MPIQGEEEEERMFILQHNVITLTLMYGQFQIFTLPNYSIPIKKKTA